MYDLQRDTVAIYKANKSPITRHAWTSLAGKRMLKLFVPIPSLVELNEPTWLSKQGTDIERTGGQMRLARAIESSEMQVLASVPRISSGTKPRMARPTPSPLVSPLNASATVEILMTSISSSATNPSLTSAPAARKNFAR